MKLKVYGVTTVCRREDKHLLDPERPWRVRVRYAAAVTSRRELAELLNVTVSSWDIVNSSVTTNKKEVELALENPHTLIFIEVR